MFSLKNVLIFFSGAEFFHTLSHILLPLNHYFLYKEVKPQMLKAGAHEK